MMALTLVQLSFAFVLNARSYFRNNVKIQYGENVSFRV